jgi:hypothetical protein
MTFSFSDRLDSEEEEVEFDDSKPWNESIRDCLKEVTSKSGKVRKARKLAHLVSDTLCLI